MKIKLLIIGILLASYTTAQTHKVMHKREGTLALGNVYRPKKALWQSTIIPGWGQLYNHRWWKVPLIYGGFAFLLERTITNQKYYAAYLTEIRARRQGSGHPDYKIYTTQQFVYAKNIYLRNRDLSVLGFLALWGLNVIDAYVDAKFIQSYDIDNNLAVKVTPILVRQEIYPTAKWSDRYIPSLKITLCIERNRKRASRKGE